MQNQALDTPLPDSTDPALTPAAGIVRGTKAYRRVSVALFMTGFATFSLLYCVQPLLPAFAAEFGIGAAQSSLALSLSTGFLAFSILAAGVVSERRGRKGMMFVSMALAAVFNIMAGLATGWHTILVMRALEGFALGGVPAIAMAYLAEEIAPQGLGFSMGLYVGGTAFGGMVGRVGMAMLTEVFSWRTAMVAIGVLDLLAAVAFLLLLPPSRRFVRNLHLKAADHFGYWRRHLHNPRLPLVFAIGCLAMGVFVTIYNYVGFRLLAAPYYLSPTATGMVFSAYLFGVVASSWSGALADRYGRGPLLAAGICCMTAGVLLTLASPLTWVVAGIVLLTIGFFTTHSVASGWVGRLAQGAKGHASSLYLLGYYLGSSVIGSAGGWFWQHWGWHAVVVFSLCVLLACLAVSMRLWKGKPA